MMNPIRNPNQAGSQPSLAPADSVVAEDVSAVEALDFVVSWRLEKGGIRWTLSAKISRTYATENEDPSIIYVYILYIYTNTDYIISYYVFFLKDKTEMYVNLCFYFLL